MNSGSSKKRVGIFSEFNQEVDSSVHANIPSQYLYTYSDSGMLCMVSLVKYLYVQ